MRVEGSLSARLDSLGPRQREMMDVICARGGATAREIRDRIPDPPATMCGLRTLLNRMARKGLVRVRRSGRHSERLYLPGDPGPDVVLSAFHRLADDHFHGSRSRALIALTRLADNEAGEADPPSPALPQPAASRP